jgi:hypothetical protein
MNVVSIAHDYGGLKCAALELLDEARLEPHRQRADRLAEFAENAEQILAAAAPKRSLADGYYARLGYLLELEQLMHLGYQFASAIKLSEMRGLLALAAARREFDALHPPCKRCGARLDNEGETTCPACWQVEAAARQNG